MFVRYRAVPPPVTSVFILAKDTAKGPTSNVCDSTRKVDVVHDNFLENVINCLPTITDVSAPLPACAGVLALQVQHVCMLHPKSRSYAAQQVYQ